MRSLQAIFAGTPATSQTPDLIFVITQAGNVCRSSARMLSFEVVQAMKLQGFNQIRLSLNLQMRLRHPAWDSFIFARDLFALEISPPDARSHTTKQHRIPYTYIFQIIQTYTLGSSNNNLNFILSGIGRAKAPSCWESESRAAQNSLRWESGPRSTLVRSDIDVREFSAFLAAFHQRVVPSLDLQQRNHAIRIYSSFFLHRHALALTSTLLSLAPQTK